MTFLLQPNRIERLKDLLFPLPHLWPAFGKLPTSLDYYVDLRCILSTEKRDYKEETARLNLVWKNAERAVKSAHLHCKHKRNHWTITKSRKVDHVIHRIVSSTGDTWILTARITIGITTQKFNDTLSKQTWYEHRAIWKLNNMDSVRKLEIQLNKWRIESRAIIRISFLNGKNYDFKIDKYFIQTSPPMLSTVNPHHDK